MSVLKDGLLLGGSGPIRLLPNTTYSGEFYCIKAIGPTDNLEITSLEIENTVTPEWDSLVLTPGSDILFPRQNVTKIVLSTTSGEGIAYKC